MGVPLTERLYIYLVVMQVDKVDVEYGRKPEDKSQKYFKTFAKPEAVIKLVGELQPHESVKSIYMVDDFGTSYPLTVKFTGGKLILEAEPQEGTR